jgi:hypothetical protein
MTIAVVAGVANVVLGCVFTLLFGPVGMAWAVITAEAIGAAGGIVAVRYDARRAVAAGAVRGTVALAAALIGASAGGKDTNDPADFSNEASATCNWARRSVEVVPQRSSRLLRTAAHHLRGVEAPADQRAAGTLTAALAHLSRSAGRLSSELEADYPDAARMPRLRAAVRGDQEKVAATARTLGVSGCDAITAGLLREATAGAPKPLSHAAYRGQLRDGLADLSQRTYRVQASMRSGSASSSTLTSYAASVGTAIERLRSLRPPARNAQAHRDLVAGLRALRAAITQAAQDLRAGSEQQAVQTLQTFYASQAFSDLTAATSTLSQSG